MIFAFSSLRIFGFLFMTLFLIRFCALTLTSLEMLLTNIYVPLFLLPAEQELLQDLLSQPHQDGEWLRFVNHRLITCPAGVKQAFLQSLLEIESSSALRDLIIGQYQQVFYANANASLYIPPRDIDLLLRSTFELLNIDFNQLRLSQLLISLSTEGPQWQFYLDVLGSDGFSILWERQQPLLALQAEREALFQEIGELARQNEQREAQNAILRQRILNLRNP
jgi:hypothetical protein